MEGLISLAHGHGHKSGVRAETTDGTVLPEHEGRTIEGRMGASVNFRCLDDRHPQAHICLCNTSLRRLPPHAHPRQGRTTSRPPRGQRRRPARRSGQPCARLQRGWVGRRCNPASLAQRPPLPSRRTRSRGACPAALACRYEKRVSSVSLAWASGGRGCQWPQGIQV